MRIDEGFLKFLNRQEEVNELELESQKEKPDLEICAFC